MSMENHGGMILIAEAPDSSTTALWQSYQQCHLLEKQKELTKEMTILPCEVYLSYFEGFLTCRKISRRGAQELYFPSKGVVLLISSSARFEPANLGSNDKHATPRPPKTT
jgi:hypothetical protein